MIRIAEACGKPGKTIACRILPDSDLIEGIEEVTEGITLPENTVQFIPPQSTTQVDQTNVAKKIQKENPSGYNP